MNKIIIYLEIHKYIFNYYLLFIKYYIGEIIIINYYKLHMYKIF